MMPHNILYHRVGRHTHSAPGAMLLEVVFVQRPAPRRRARQWSFKCGDLDLVGLGQRYVICTNTRLLLFIDARRE
jgi:hypothetical protein